MSPDPTESMPNDTSRLRSLFDAHSPSGHSSGSEAEARSRLTSQLVGSEITLPESVPMWHHLHRSTRELERVPYDGGPLVVHNVESAGSSFLVHGDDGQPHSRRGPAVTLHRPDDAAHDDLLVVFSVDLEG